MKQLIILEQHEIAKLIKGKQMEIATPGGVLLLAFDRNAVGEPKVECTICPEGKRKSFKNKLGLDLHRARMHKNHKAKAAGGAA